MNCDMDSCAPDWLIEHPETASVFQQLAIDTSCGGKSLLYLCNQQGLDSDQLLVLLQKAIRDARKDET